MADPSRVADELIRAAVDHLDAGIIVADVDGRLVFVNELAAQMHALRRIDIGLDAHADVYRLFRRDGSRSRRERPLAEAGLNGETVRDSEWIIRRPDGTEALAVGSARSLHDAAGKPVGAVLTLVDDRRPAVVDAERRDRDLLARRLRDAFEQSPVSTVVYDADGHPLAVNPAFERLWGASITDVPPSYSVLTDPQLHAAGVIPAIRKAFEGEIVHLPPLRYEMGQSVGRGRVLWTQAHLYPVRNVQGAIEQVVLSHEDVTARKDVEEALSLALERTERLQELTAELSRASTAAEIGAVVVEHARVALGAMSVIVARVAPSGEELEIVNVGEAPESVIEPWLRFPLETPVPLADAVRKRSPIFLESLDAWLAAYPTMRADLLATGHQATMVMPLLVNGTALGVIGAAFGAAQHFDDDMRAFALTVAQQCAQALDRSRLLDAERAARREAEAANEAKAEFLAVMSHELRTPLNAIGGYAELLEMDVHGSLSESQRRDVSRIQASQRHLLGLINEVLNYAKLESGSVSYEITSVFVRQALETALELVNPQATAKGLAVSAGECAPDLAVRADSEKLQQILVNLLSNAVKFTDAGSIELSSVADAQMVRINVRDSGIGIPANHLGRIFEPFVQVRADLKRTAEGTGLGLAISRDLARAMHGDLTVTSEIGRGSTFTLALPRA